MSEVQRKKLGSYLFDGICVTLILIGIIFRFQGVAWNQGTNLHPDEYGLTNTLTRLQIPGSIDEYFNTRLSPISPYDKYGFNGEKIADGPDNRMRWGQLPIMLIRYAAEATGQTGYDEIRLLGRKMSALADIGSVLLIGLIAWRLFGNKIGLLAAALSALAVMQIQQSHFMTVDNFGTFFVTLGMFACVQVSKRACVVRKEAGYHFDQLAWFWCLIFGVALGLALACKVNLLPLAGMILLALGLSIADLRLKSPRSLWVILAIAGIHLFLAAFASLLTFRLAQPMTFRAPSGDTSFWTLYPNPDWVESMKLAQMESSGLGGGPPAEQWAHRPAIIFPLVNIVFWGLGLPLGIAAWVSFLLAGFRFIWPGAERRAMLLPLVWTGGYFLFMGTRWVKSVRYFLPIYPFLCLFAAWGLVRLWGWAAKGRWVARAVAISLAVIVIGSTLIWANAFTSAVYRSDHTRIQAALWIFDHIAGPFQLELDTGGQPVGAPGDLLIYPGADYQTIFTAIHSGDLTGLRMPHVSASAPTRLVVRISSASNSNVILSEVEIPLPAGTDMALSVPVDDGSLQAGEAYWLTASSLDDALVTLQRNVIANEHWDEGLPMYFAGQDPFGQLYRGISNQVRWYDDQNKRNMLIETLSEADYLVLPSQRGIWSTCRLPDMYPMTIAYYRALFEGRLGFNLVAQFQAPFHFGPLQVSDVGGTWAWGQTPQLPLFNNRLLAAEEAFSVYDHPPVWIFQKRDDFDPQAVADVLDAIDLSHVVIQSPRDATGLPCQP